MTKAEQLKLWVVMKQLAKSGVARQIREESGISLRQLAEVIGDGVDDGVLSRWERGLHAPRPARGVAWYQALAEVTGRDLSKIEIAA